ncbi:MAG: sel1 repeat family protein [Pseudodesulfovibrio sp.]
MNTLKTISLVALLVLTMAFTAFATPLDDGFKADKQGDMESAVRHFLLAAEQGDMFGQAIIGTMYYHGDGVEQDYTKAAKWLKAAAEQGDEDAQRDYGKMLHKGEGVSQDYVLAYKWLRIATKRRVEDAAEALQQLEPLMTLAQISDGQRLAKDWKDNNLVEVPLAVLSGKPRNSNFFMLKRKFIEALSMFRWSAEQGEPGGQLYLGLAYLNGAGEQQNNEEAIHWIQKAAEQGYQPAQSELSLLYYDGVHATQDYERSMHWARKAADQGNAQAALMLGLGYAKGEGVSQNFVHAYKWLTVSHQLGVDLAVEVRKKIVTVMTEEEIKHGKIQAERWKPLKN